MKTFDITYSYKTEARNSFGEVEALRYGRTITLEGKKAEQVEAVVRKSLEDKEDVKVSVCEH